MFKLGRKFGVTAVLALAVGACQTENSSTLDADSFNSTITPEFAAARAIFSSNCVPCHTYHAQTEDQLKAQGLVLGGNVDGSLIYCRLQGSTGSCGSKNMPMGGALTADQLADIAAWIQTVAP